MAKAWIVTRHADVERILKDKRFGRGRGYRVLRRLNQPLQPLEQMRSGWMSLRDPPDHTRMRRLVSDAFAPKVVAHLRPRIRAIANQLLERVGTAPEVELVGAFAYPLPMSVIVEIMDLPHGDWELLSNFSAGIDSIYNIRSRQDLREGNRVAEELMSYFRARIEEKQGRAGDDLVSQMLRKAGAHHSSDLDEIAGACVFLLHAGHQTTMSLIASAMLLLLQHPQQLELLKARPELMRSAVNEALRCEPPFPQFMRKVLKTTRLSGKTLEAGQHVIGFIYSANRDPREFSEPDEFNILRSEGQSLSFGAGIHHCLGMPLALMEAELAITAVMERYPNVALAEQTLEWRDEFVLHGLKALWLKL